MSWGIYGILIIFGIFVFLLILNPNLSCFGKRVKSPLYPVLRKRKHRVKTEDYGFKLVDGETKGKMKKKYQRKKANADGFPPASDSTVQESIVRRRKLKTQDYSFSLVEPQAEPDAKGGEEDRGTVENK